MERLEITDADRDPKTGRIMADAQQRAAERDTTPPEPDEPAPRPRTLSNRRGHAEPARPAASYKSALGPIAGVLGTLILIALGARLLPGAAPLADRAIPTVATTPGPAGATDDRRPTTDDGPAAAPASATIDAYAAPDGALLGPIDASAPIVYRYGSTSWGGVEWHGKVVWIQADHAPPASYPDLAPPTPAPTVERIIIEVPVAPPCNVETNPRYTAQIDVSAGGRPLGIATGRSCDSQADAQANAESIAREMRAALPTAAPQPTPAVTIRGDVIGMTSGGSSAPIGLYTAYGATIGEAT